MSSEIQHKLFQLASKRFGISPDQLSSEQDIFEALNINSIQALSFLTDLEKEFKIEIPDYELQDVRTFAQLVSLIQTRV